MQRCVLFLFALVNLSILSASSYALQVVELFTSYNCPSCPPAERYINELSGTDDILTLSFHIDYWNTKTWEDPYAHADFTQRQYDYSNTLGTRPGRVYTPQVVINGSAVAGNPLSISVPFNLAKLSDIKHLEITADYTLDLSLLTDYTPQRYNIWLVGYDASVPQDHHGHKNGHSKNVVRHIREIHPTTSESLTVSFNKETLPNTSHIAILIQEQGPGAIVAAAFRSISK